MKKTARFIFLALAILLFFGPTEVVHADSLNLSLEVQDGPTIVYFYVENCEGCQAIDDAGILPLLEAQGVTIIIKDLRYDENIERMSAYSDFYRVPARQRYTPLMFAGEDYYFGGQAIINAYYRGDLFASAQNQLLNVPDEYISLTGFSGLLRVIVAGLIDSVNPCAIAMLLMFISMVGVLKDRKTLLMISLSYIGAIFITYFLIGIFLFTLMQTYAAQINTVQTGLYIGFAALCLVLFAITFYDFMVTRKQDYSKVKNQLPQFIQAFNKRFMSKFTRAITDEKPSVKRTFLAIGIPFLIGVVVAFTEAACTGQVYGLILISIRSVHPTTGYIYLFVFNIIFVLPLIVIASIAIYSRNIMGISNFIRERLPMIKLATSIFFFLMMFYFLFDVLDISLIQWLGGLF